MGENMKKVLFIIAVAVILFTSCVGEVKAFREIHRVTFDLQGNGEEIPPQAVYEGEKAIHPGNPTADQFVFEGWYKSLAYETLFSFSTAITEDTVLYAKWRAE